MSDDPGLDKFDRALLEVLQRDGRATNQQLASRVQLSAAPCWRRVKQLEKRGIIERYAALLNPDKLGLRVSAYVHVSLEDHHTESVESFDAFVAADPQVLECASVSGEHDYLLRVVARDVAELEAFLMQRLLKVSAVKAANTSIVLRQKKSTTALPLPGD